MSETHEQQKRVFGVFFYQLSTYSHSCLNYAEVNHVFVVFYENISARQINNNLKKTNMKINWSTIKKIIQIIITILTSIVGTLCVQSCMNA